MQRLLKIAQIPQHRFDLVRDEVFDICREIRADQNRKARQRCVDLIVNGRLP